MNQENEALILKNRQLNDEIYPLKKENIEKKEEISRLKSLLLTSKKKPNEIEILDINDYKEGEFIGEEATSIVRILIKSENEKFAKKELKGFTQKVLQQFLTEGDNLFKNRHPYIIRIIYVNYGDDTHAPWILLKLEPTSLEKAILNNELDENEKNRFTAELVLGMRYIHSRNFMYRNLKLSNILLSKNRHVRISDFGPPEVDELEASESKNIGILRF